MSTETNCPRPAEDREMHAYLLEIAEQQFSLASAVHLATTEGRQPLDLPTEWSHGKHIVHYEEIAVSSEEADRAAFYLQRCATYLIAAQIHQTLKRIFPNAREHPETEVQSVYQITRMIRNAFTHNVFNPVWSIDKDCRNRTFEIKGIIKFDTSSLDGKPFDWRDYGGPLALLRLSQFVRKEILKQPPTKERDIATQDIKRFQQGNLILKELTEEEDQELRIKGRRIRKLSKGDELHLPGGHILRSKE